MLSTRLTGSSTSITSVSMRSARSTGSSAPGLAKCSLANARLASAAEPVASGWTQLADLRVWPVEERVARRSRARGRRRPRRRPSRTSGSRRRPRRRPARLHDLDVLGDLARRAGRRRPSSWLTIGSLIAAIAPASAGSMRLGRDRDPVVVGAEVARRPVRRSANSSPSRPPTSSKPMLNVSQPALAGLGEQRHDQARVEPAGEQDADRDVGDHAPLDRASAARRARRRCQSPALIALARRGRG